MQKRGLHQTPFLYNEPHRKAKRLGKQPEGVQNEKLVRNSKRRARI